MSDENDVLIRASPEHLAHNMIGEVPVGHLPYWRVHGTPRQTKVGRTILFSDGERVIARGLIAKLEDGRIWFSPLEAVDEELPAEPPERGFKYVTDETVSVSDSREVPA